MVGNRQATDALQTSHLMFNVQAGSNVIRLAASPGLGTYENAAAVVIASLKVTLAKEINLDLTGKSYDMDNPDDIKRALGYIITSLGGTATNVPTT